MNWAALHNHSHYSLQHSASNPTKIIERAVQAGLKAVALTDKHSMSGLVNFFKNVKSICRCGHHKNSHGDSRCYGNHKKCTCTSFEKTDIKPILGSEFYLTDGSHITTLAKNYQGWKALIALTSAANKQENIYGKQPRISLEEIAKLANGNLMVMSGLYGSQIGNNMFDEMGLFKLPFQKTYAEARSLIIKDKYKKTIELAAQYRDMFGADNFKLEAQSLDRDAFPGGELLANAMRVIANEIGVACVASVSSYYAHPEDADDQRLQICSSLNSDYGGIAAKLSQPAHTGLQRFFTSDKHYMPTPSELLMLHNEEEVANAAEVADQCEAYNILSKPIMPVFDCPNDKNPDEYLKELCIRGWKKKIASKIPGDKLPAYKEQIRTELEVIQGAGLSSYFLIVEDYCRVARDVMGQLLSPGRGSSSGSLLAYLTDITKVDPIKYDLMFERFYNAGRNTAERTSLPDIDTDFEDRDQAIEYVRNKYGAPQVSQMITFGSNKGKGSLKEVFRIKYPDIPFDEVNKITESIPDEAAISDKLQEMKEAGEEPSIIMWALETSSKRLKDFCYLDDNGDLQGEYAPAFKQAIRLEGVKKSQGKHPSGTVISHEPLSNLVPMIYDKGSKQSIAGLEMYDLEDMGICKFDLLETAVLRKLHNVSKFLGKAIEFD